ncbi:response regulator transcription factor [Acidimicrobiia bacterium EGI L10123]|uniref:response regulator transcription factor n=1 Tax=Salinilacustrithrix flava TaxID=2957203 RepID=UPI003D7C2C6B|nr:response regulator transcription factor [Acidimicrobiia bacterium EGI L10123]
MAVGGDRASVLVVEDDADIRDVLARLLDRDGFEPHTCATGADAAATLGAVDAEVVLLDLGLPDVNGFDLLRTIRSRSDAIVIVLSGWASESDRVLALELGADDYVVKPFLTRELVARIRAHRRRSTASTAERPDGLLVEGDLRIDPRTREVTVAGEAVDLTAREFDLLHFLASSPRQVFSRDQILEHAWGSSVAWQQDATVTEHVHRLRQKVGADRIATVRSVGYRFEPLVPSHVAE